MARSPKAPAAGETLRRARSDDAPVSSDAAVREKPDDMALLSSRVDALETLVVDLLEVMDAAAMEKLKALRGKPGKMIRGVLVKDANPRAERRRQQILAVGMGEAMPTPKRRAEAASHSGAGEESEAL